jgi:hypothetical protein
MFIGVFAKGRKAHCSELVHIMVFYMFSEKLRKKAGGFPGATKSNGAECNLLKLDSAPGAI